MADPTNGVSPPNNPYWDCCLGDYGEMADDYRMFITGHWRYMTGRNPNEDVSNHKAISVRDASNSHWYDIQGKFYPHWEPNSEGWPRYAFNAGRWGQMDIRKPFHHGTSNAVNLNVGNGHAVITDTIDCTQIKEHPSIFRSQKPYYVMVFVWEECGNPANTPANGVFCKVNDQEIENWYSSPPLNVGGGRFFRSGVWVKPNHSGRTIKWEVDTKRARGWTVVMVVTGHPGEYGDPRIDYQHFSSRDMRTVPVKESWIGKYSSTLQIGVGGPVNDRQSVPGTLNADGHLAGNNCFGGDVPLGCKYWCSTKMNYWNRKYSIASFWRCWDWSKAPGKERFKNFYTFSSSGAGAGGVKEQGIYIIGMENGLRDTYMDRINHPVQPWAKAGPVTTPTHPSTGGSSHTTTNAGWRDYPGTPTMTLGGITTPQQGMDATIRTRAVTDYIGRHYSEVEGSASFANHLRSPMTINGIGPMPSSYDSEGHPRVWTLRAYRSMGSGTLAQAHWEEYPAGNIKNSQLGGVVFIVGNQIGITPEARSWFNSAHYIRFSWTYTTS